VIREMSTRIQPDLLEKIRSSNTRISCRVTTVRLEKAGSTMLEIRPKNVGTDTEGWTVGPEEISVQTLEEGIIVGMEIQARE
tara:strand:- start:208 stop:453 length:246 start_codon:yes stop_codon:yes gene_type:complete